MSSEHPEVLERQARLDEDLSLATLAAEAGLSPHHFHRMFRGLTGETPKQYCQRLRLERAAYRLLVFGGKSIFDVALDCGYVNHETFTRAFGKRFGVSPREYRASGRRPSSGDNKTQISQLHDGFELSQTRVRELDDIPVAFIRHVGPYEEESRTLDAMRAFAEEQGLRPHLWHHEVYLSDPRRVPPERLKTILRQQVA